MRCLCGRAEGRAAGAGRPPRGWSPGGQECQAADRVRAAHRPGGPPGGGPGAAGQHADPAAFAEIVKVVRGKFKLARMIMVGDRGMITSARIDALRQS
jgi:hypothetical protein